MLVQPFTKGKTCLLTSNLDDWHWTYCISTLHVLGWGGAIVDSTFSSSLTAGRYSHSSVKASRLTCCSCGSLCSGSDYCTTDCSSCGCSVELEHSTPWFMSTRTPVLTSPEMIGPNSSSSSELRSREGGREASMPESNHPRWENGSSMGSAWTHYINTRELSLITTFLELNLVFPRQKLPDWRDSSIIGREQEVKSR